MSSADTNTTTPLPTGGATPNANAEVTEDQPTSNSQGATSTQNRGQGNSGGATFRISNFKGEVSEVGAVIGTKLENRTKDSMTFFQEKIASYVMCEYKKGRDKVQLIKR